LTDDLSQLSDQDLLKLYKQVRTSTGAGGASQKLTEDQAKAQTYGRLMANAEGSYQRAVQRGYNPGSPRNVFASVAEGLPFGGLDGLGAVIRDDVGDQARQAEMQWSDAQLKAVSGAASPEAEVKRNVQTYFPRPGENADKIGPQKMEARRTAFESSKVRAGPAGEMVGPYYQNLPMPARQTYRRLYSQGRIDPKAPMGSEKNPYSPRDEATMDRLPKGTYVVTPDGHLGIVE
jgi:hypothetical protein